MTAGAVAVTIFVVVATASLDAAVEVEAATTASEEVDELLPNKRSKASWGFTMTISHPYFSYARSIAVVGLLRWELEPER